MNDESKYNEIVEKLYLEARPLLDNIAIMAQVRTWSSLSGPRQGSCQLDSRLPSPPQRELARSCRT